MPVGHGKSSECCRFLCGLPLGSHLSPYTAIVQLSAEAAVVDRLVAPTTLASPDIGHCILSRLERCSEVGMQLYCLRVVVHSRLEDSSVTYKYLIGRRSAFEHLLHRSD